jgi:hypothetical protein
MVTIRIGAGRTKYGKILDRDTEWYTLEQKEHAINAAIRTGKKIYISDKRQPYQEITLEELRNL